MNQPLAAKPPIPHLVPTVLIGIVCLFSLLAAGAGLYASSRIRADMCSLVASQLWGIHSTVRNDQHLIPADIKHGAFKIMGDTHGFLTQHCPPETIKPPAAVDNGNPKEILKQLMGSMLE